MRRALVAVSPNGRRHEHANRRAGCRGHHLEEPRSMLSNRTHQPFVMDDAEAAPDRGMLVLQYMVAAVAMVAAVLLALVN